MGPVELVKCRLQIANSMSSGSNLTNRDIIREIVKSDGVLGLSRGLGYSTCRETISCGIYFSVYEAIVQYFRGEEGKLGDLNAFQLFIAGGISGTMSWTANYPVDAIKSIVQVDGFRKPMKYPRSDGPYARLIAQDLGVRGLYRGLSVTLMRAFPVSAVMLPTYTLTMQLLESFHNKYS